MKMKAVVYLTIVVAGAILALSACTAQYDSPSEPAAGGAENPCNPCNPCGGEAENPCNPCGD